jgi:glutaminyl-peptide cyclotransferase
MFCHIVYEFRSGKMLSWSWRVYAERDENPLLYWASMALEVLIATFLFSILIRAVPRNIVVKLHGTGSGIVLYTTHYDTVRIPNFVGADDGGSGTGTMIELARLFCARKNALNVWIAFFDGEEAQGNWTDGASVRWNNDGSNNTFGSREMAAQMKLSGELKRAKAMILADMIGPKNARIPRDTGSTRWLTDFIWETAAQLGYQHTFVNEGYAVGGDDHFSFIGRGVAGCDLIQLSVPYWHTTQDTLDKVDPKSLAIVGQVLAATLPRFEKKFP